MPPWPTSKYHLMPMSWENSRVSRPRVALAASFAGWKWSWVTAPRSGSQIFSAPICSRMILPAGGMVRSWPIAKSTLASTRSPGRTLSRPAPRARIFSVIVMPIAGFLVLQPFCDGVSTFTCRQVSAEIARALSRANGRFDRTLNRVCHFVVTQVCHQHRSAEDRTDRVGKSAAGDVWRRAVHRFEQAPLGLGIDVSRRSDAHAADELRRQVGENVAKQVAGHDHVELGGIPDQLHRGRVHEERAGLDLRMFRGDRLPPLLPQRARVRHGVRLVDHHDLAPPDAEGIFDDAIHANVGVEVLLDRNLVFGALLETAAHADVKALGVLTHDQEVDLAPVFAAQRRQAIVVEAGRPQVDVEVEFEAQPEQHPGQVGGIIDAWVADRSEKNGVSLFQLLPRGGRYGLAGPHVLLGVDVELFELEVGARGPQDLDRLGDNLLARTIAGQDGDVLWHQACAGSPAGFTGRA